MKDDDRPPETHGNASVLLEAVAEIARTFSLASLDEKIATGRRLLARPDTVAVAVLGSFKAGKSSFLNTLAGESLLPVAAVPATAILTHVHGGPTVAASVTLAESGARVVPIGELAEWVTEDRNPHNRKKVTNVEVEAPGLARYAGLDFIDTPGLGSVFAHNTDASLALLPRVEAAILATPCTAPLAAADATLLRRIAEITPCFAVLLTKADQCTLAQRDEVGRFVAHQLDDAGVKATIHFWSQEEGFAAQRESFLRDVIDPLAAGRMATMDEIAIHKVNQLVREADSLLAVGAAAARRSHEEREQLRARLDALCIGTASVPATLARLEHEAKAGCMERTLAVVGPAVMPLREEFHQKLAPALAGWGGTLATAGARYESWIKGELTGQIAVLGRNNHTAMLAPLGEFAAGCEQLVGLFHTQLTDMVTETLGVTLEPPTWRAEFTPPARTDISISPAFDLRFDWLYALTPVAWVRPWFRRHLRRRLAWEAEKNISRLASQWTRALGASITTLAGAASAHVETQRTTLSNLLAAKQPDPAAWETARYRLVALQIADEESEPREPTGI